MDRRTTKEVINEALRLGLAPKAGEPAAPYVAPVHSSGVRPGFDPMRLNRLIDDLSVSGGALPGTRQSGSGGRSAVIEGRSSAWRPS